MKHVPSTTRPHVRWLQVLEDRTGLELLAEVEGEEAAPAAPAEPTMMSREARQMFLDGEGDEALRVWRKRYYKEKLDIGLAGGQSPVPVVQAFLEVRACGRWMGGWLH